jgi:site-specific DNA-methyltransferase (adenine-specific)
VAFPDQLIYHGDALRVLPTLAPGTVHAVLTDFPYGVTSQPWDQVPPLGVLWENLVRVLCPRGVVVTTANQPFASRLIVAWERWFRHDLVWVKTRGSNWASVRREPLRKHEYILVFAPGPHTYNPQKEPGTPYRSRTQHPREDTAYGGFGKADYQPEELRDTRHPGSVLEVSSLRQQDLTHPTQKPLDLYLKLVATYTNLGDTVLDPYLGSGTTLAACARLGRRGIGMEVVRRYAELAARRVGGRLVVSFAGVWVAPDESVGGGLGPLSRGSPGCEGHSPFPAPVLGVGEEIPRKGQHDGPRLQRAGDSRGRLGPDSPESGPGD